MLSSTEYLQWWDLNVLHDKLKSEIYVYTYGWGKGTKTSDELVAMTSELLRLKKEIDSLSSKMNLQKDN